MPVSKTQSQFNRIPYSRTPRALCLLLLPPPFPPSMTQLCANKKSGKPQLLNGVEYIERKSDAVIYVHFINKIDRGKIA